jgi:1-acyl-sn-glycerol-3-phosphate acyltransferase
VPPDQDFRVKPREGQAFKAPKTSLHFPVRPLKCTTYEKKSPAMNPLYFILSVWGWVCYVLLTVVYNLLGLIFVLPLSLIFDHKTRYLMHAVAVIWGKSIMGSTPVWRLHVNGHENIEKGKNYVIIANHQSMLDILVALAGLPLSLHFKFMAKKELFKIPFMGWHMSAASYIPIDRSSAHSGRDALLRARDWLEKKVSVLFFPEGTRSLDGEMKKYKVGAFKAAQDSGVEILPVIMDGTGEALPKNSFFVKKVSHMVVSIGKPVKIKPDENLEQASEKIWSDMKKRLAEIRRRENPHA